jgi:hypothetical protein
MMDEPFKTDDPHLQGVYAAVNAIVQSQQMMIDMMHAKDDSEVSEE